MSQFNRLAAPALLVAPLLLVACGGGAGNESSDSPSPQAAGRANFDPCSLMSSAEISAITTDKVIRADRDGATCYYRSAPDEALQVTVHRSGGAEQMKTIQRTADLLGGMGQTVADKGGAGQDVNELLKKGTTHAPKLGDEAVWGMNNTLSVRKGDAFVEISPPLLHDPATHSGYPLITADEKRAIATQVAAVVLRKL